MLIIGCKISQDKMEFRGLFIFSDDKIRDIREGVIYAKNF